LRKDPVFGILAGGAELEQPLAGKSTLNRLPLPAANQTTSRKSPSGKMRRIAGADLYRATSAGSALGRTFFD
jgi:hypothetical protein